MKIELKTMREKKFKSETSCNNVRKFITIQNNVSILSRSIIAKELLFINLIPIYNNCY